MNSNFSYHMPTKIIYGNNELDNIDKYINGRKTLLITSSGFVKRGLVDKIKSLTNNIVEVISEVKSHPEFKDLEVTYNKIQEIDFELILAIGGGSVLDASKFFSVYNKTKEYQFVQDLIKGKIEKKDYKLTPIISIPTTAGTGSETSRAAAIINEKTNVKNSFSFKNAANFNYIRSRINHRSSSIFNSSNRHGCFGSQLRSLLCFRLSSNG